MKVYSAYKPMAPDDEADVAPSTLEKSSASGRQEKSKVCSVILLYHSAVRHMGLVHHVVSLLTAELHYFSLL